MTPKPKLKRLKISQLTPDPDNARMHGRDNLKAIQASLERFGQVRPILASADLTVIAGNGTLAAAQAMGLDTLEVLVLPWTDRETCRAYAIADNRSAELASWDEDTLVDQIGDLRDAGIDMGDYGFRAKGHYVGRTNLKTEPEAVTAAREAARGYRCPSCGYRWRFGDGGEVVTISEDEVEAAE